MAPKPPKIAKAIKSLEKLPNITLKDVNISDNVFKIHTKLTVYCLLVFAVLVSGHALKPINCIVGNKDYKPVAEALCWVNGTFTLQNVSTIINGTKTWKLVRQDQHYYQWTVILLLLQAALFSIPHLLWKAWENGRIRHLCGSSVMTTNNPKYQSWKHQTIIYLTLDNSRIHGSYVLRYIACEVMNFLLVVINMIILNVVFHQFWIRYFPAIMTLFTANGPSFNTQASIVFPTTTKCDYRKFGSSGSLEIHDALCLLTLNIINEKVFAFIYIWYILLLFISGCNLIVRSVILLSSTIRFKIIQSISMWSKPLTRKQLQLILHGDNIGDWFIIFLLGQNLNRFVFSDILEELAEHKLKT